MSGGFTAEEFEPDAVDEHRRRRRQRHHGEGRRPATPATPTATATTPATPPGETRKHAPVAHGGSSTGGNNDWPVLGAAAYHGLAGEVVNTIAPQTEADPVALLLQYLVYCGNAVGRGPYFQVEQGSALHQPVRLLVGDTAKARKGLSAGHIRDFYMSADPDGPGTASEAA